MSVSLTSNFFLNARGITFADGGGLVWAFNRNTNTLTATGGSGGVLSSVGVADTSSTPIYTVSSSPLTTNGTIDLTLNAQARNTAFAGPITGANAQPTFRALVSADIPTLSYVTSVGSSNLTVGGTALAPTLNLSATQVSNIALGATAVQVGSTPTWTGTHIWDSASGSTVLSAQTPTTALFSIIRCTDQTGVRQLEIVYCGSASGGAYGAAQGTAVINAHGAGLTLSVADATVAALSASGVALANGFSIRGNSIPAQPTGYGTPTGNALTSSFAAGSISLGNLAAEVAQLILDLKKYGIIGA